VKPTNWGSRSVGLLEHLANHVHKERDPYELPHHDRRQQESHPPAAIAAWVLLFALLLWTAIGYALWFFFLR
jgi:hypothetical protein